MLIEFSVENFLSFRKRVTFSMVADTIKEHFEDNAFGINFGKIRGLKSAAIYGANASGKSNLIKAIAWMKQLVMQSVNFSQSNQIELANTFRLDESLKNKPSRFEIIFIEAGKQFRYGFEVTKNEIIAEWLFVKNNRKETQLFIREKNKFELNRDFKEGKGLEKNTTSRALFITVTAQFNGKISAQVLNWFNHLSIIQEYMISLSNQAIYQVLKKHPAHKQKILKFLRLADIHIDDFEFDNEKISGADLSANLGGMFNNLVIPEISYIKVSTYRKSLKKSNVKFDLDTEESGGTKKIFALALPIFLSLEFGRTIIIDEIEENLHFLLTKAIICLFNSTANKKNAQLIFTTHDTNLLANKLFRRDQIWFTEKDESGATDLYSLIDIEDQNKNKIRNDASFEKDYLLGKYGAIPFIGDLFSLFAGNANEK